MSSNYKITTLDVVNELMEQINDGRLSPGHKLPSERQAAEMYKTTRAIIHYAYKKLENENLVVRKHGSGTYARVAELKKMDIRRLNDRVNGGMTSIIEDAGGVASSIVLNTGIISGNFFSKKLGIDKDAPIFALHRVRCANNIPIAMEYTYVPAEYFDDIYTVNFAKNSLYNYFKTKECLPVKFNERIQIVDVVERERVFMELPENVPVYWYACTGFDQDNRIIEYTETFARCDMFELNLDTSHFVNS